MGMTPPDRRVITFYSYKGGVGRTMALANVAYRLANTHGLNVIAVDWDLEAPGLHKFFGISPERAAKAHGVLDYFIAWRKALKRMDPEPPQVGKWIIPITDKDHKPKFGSVSLLLAGKLDEKYDKRLGKFNWQTFYARDSGAAAVETLREQLVGKADVVLVDSRTGLTDPGGICTIQLPDAVVLMTAPNEQSLEGIWRVASAIAKAPDSARAGRRKPKAWLSVSRVASVDETYLAERWFRDHDSWFSSGIETGLWVREDHPDGLRSHVVPQRGRWSFGEKLLNEHATIDPMDPLVLAYAHLSSALLRWVRAEPAAARSTLDRGTGVRPGGLSIEALEGEVADAEQRGDILGMALSLARLGSALRAKHRNEEAIREAERAAGIFLSRGARAEYVITLGVLVDALLGAGRLSEAKQVAEKALRASRELGEPQIMMEAFRYLADVAGKHGDKMNALRFVREARQIADEVEDEETDAAGLWLLATIFHKLGEIREAIELYRRSVQVARTDGEVDAEKRSIGSLINIADNGAQLPDVPALRARLAELEAAQPTPK